MPVSKCEKQDEEVWMHTANPKTLQAEIRKLKNTQRTLHRALGLLFDLLEEYAPLWYGKRYHDEAKAALKRVEPQPERS